MVNIDATEIKLDFAYKGVLGEISWLTLTHLPSGKTIKIYNPTSLLRGQADALNLLQKELNILEPPDFGQDVWGFTPADDRYPASVCLDGEFEAARLRDIADYLDTLSEE